MANDNERMLQLCIYDYLTEKGRNESARVLREETGLQDDDVAIYPGPSFFRDWWDNFYNAYFSRPLNTSTSMQNALPELPVTMPKPDISFPGSSSSIPNKTPNFRPTNVDNNNLINSDPLLNYPSYNSSHWQESPQFPHQYLATDQMFDVGVGIPNPLSSGTYGMLSSYGDIVGSGSVPMRGLSSIDQSISSLLNFGTQGMLDYSQPIDGLSSSGSTLMPMSGLPLMDQSISVGLERQNPPMFDTHGMPNFPQPIVGLSSAGDGVGSNSTSMNKKSASMVQTRKKQLMSAPRRRPRDQYISLSVLGGKSGTNADIDSRANTGNGVKSSSTSMNKSASDSQTKREQRMRLLSENQDKVAQYLKANPPPQRIRNNLGDKTALGGTSGTNADIDNSSNTGASLVIVENMRLTFGQLICCDFSSDGNMLACVTPNKTVVIWSTVNNLFDTPERKHRSRNTDVRFIPYTSYVGASYLDKIVKIWDATKPREVLQTLLPNETVVSMDFNPNNSGHLYCADKDEIRLWNVTQNTNEIFFQGAARQVRVRPGEGNVLAALLMANEIGLYDVKTKSLLFSFKGHEKEIHTICWDISGQYIASVSEDEARIWAINSSTKPIHEIKSTGKMFYSCTVHPELAQAFVIGSYQTLEVWNPCMSNNTKSVYAHRGIVSALCTSSEAGLIASTSNDNNNCIRLWRTKMI